MSTVPAASQSTGEQLLETLRGAELLRDFLAGRLADAVADGTLDDWSAGQVDDYRAHRAAAVEARVAWTAYVDGLLAEHDRRRGEAGTR